MRCSWSVRLLMLLAVAAAAAETEKQAGKEIPKEVAARLDRCRPLLRSRDKAAREKGYEGFLREGAEGRAQLVMELLGIRSAAIAACRGVSLSAESQKKLLTAHKKLEDARKEALRVIFDKKIYPDADHGRVGQPVVDKAVDAVKAVYPLYRRAFDSLLQRFARTGRAYERLKEVDTVLERCEAKDVELHPTLEAILGQGFPPELVKLPTDEAAHLDACQRILRYNGLVYTTATAAERHLVEVTNEYRMQLGLKPLAISEALTQAARKHSQEMQRLNYFGHDSPTAENRSPGQRCANEGYKGFRGENIASGCPPDAAFNMWYNSSGHHRNMLGGHNEIGVGQGGPWTEDFGARPDLDLDNPPRAKPPTKK